MVKKGLGTWQFNRSKEASQAIVQLLMDGEWHRYQELREQSGMSSATLSKHLKELEKGIVEKDIRLNTGEYPYPVFYRIKKEYRDVLSKEQETITECSGFTNVKITPVNDENQGEEYDDELQRDCLKRATEALESALAQAYGIYCRDKNWNAFQQMAGSARILFDEALLTIFKKE